MKLLTCVKIVPDLEQLRTADWQGGCERLRQQTEFAARVLSCFDEGALELALRCRDLAPSETSLQVLSVGGCETVPFFRTLLALGFSETILIRRETAQFCSPAATAALIASAVRSRGMPDVILTGSQSSDENNGETGFMLAEMLNLLCISDVTSFVYAGEGRLLVKSAAGRTVVRRLVETPVLLSIGNTECSSLRVPTLKNRLAASAMEISTESAAELSAFTEPTLASFAVRKMERFSHFVDGSDASKAAVTIYNEYLRGRLVADDM